MTPEETKTKTKQEQKGIIMRPNRVNTPIADLRKRVARIERGAAVAAGAGVLPLGLSAVDSVLPGGGLARACVHEISGRSADGFAALLAARLDGPVLWCAGRRAVDPLYGPGLARFGLGPDRLLVALCESRTDGLWAMEEGLRSRALAAVIAEPDGAVDITASRRLQLAAEAGGTTGFILPGGAVRGRLAPSAVTSRWRVEPQPAPEEGGDVLHWRVELLRCRGGAQASWEMTCDGTADRFRLAAAVADRPAEPDAERHVG